MTRWSVIIVVALASAAAAEPTNDHTKAIELFEDGRKLMNAKDYVGACMKFSESIRLEPLAAGTMLNLGLCHEELGRYKTALYWFRKAQIRATETNPPLPDYEQEAREHTTHLAPIVATIKIVVPADAPADTQVAIDDEAVRPEDYAHVEIDPGHHVVTATATGKPTFRHELHVSGRGGQTVRVAFHEAAPPQPKPQPLVDQPAHPISRRQLAVYVGIGGGALLAGSLGLTLYEKHVYNQNKPAALAGDRKALEATQHASEIARDWGTGLAVLGLAAGGLAAYLYLSAPDEQTIVAPAVGPGVTGAVVTRRF